MDRVRVRWLRVIIPAQANLRLLLSLLFKIYQPSTQRIGFHFSSIHSSSNIRLRGIRRSIRSLAGVPSSFSHWKEKGTSSSRAWRFSNVASLLARLSSFKFPTLPKRQSFSPWQPGKAVSNPEERCATQASPYPGDLQPNEL